MRTTGVLPLKAAAIFPLVAGLARALGAEPCNGHAELCGRAYSNVSYACTHNAYSYPPPSVLPVLNQERTIAEQLGDGVRALMLDVVRPGPDAGASGGGGGSIVDKVLSWFSAAPKSGDLLDAVHLCHQSCALIDKGRLSDALTAIREFLDANPREVVTIIFENVSGFSAQELRPSFEAAGADKYAFVPGFAPTDAHSGYPWPTLEQMIAQGQRLVVFIDENADPAQVPYILPEWEYVVETPYANIVPVAQFPCNQDRPRDGVSRDLVVMNHFAYNRATIGSENIDTPLTAAQAREHGYNSIDALTAHAETCAAVWGPHRIMNFITLDYYDIGDGAIFQLVDRINGISA
ncbi:hypothetical protein H4R18_003002 [Coemansia javaensis]|uniref:PLC-like phosphodiesterase n=1 Tax=Coemansia javaensis TaxID=2761396 RepID=A0A9W8LGY9_9FUNG|nr:hypothetical protein H4R18_003002 [Coemansia javaensis]